jgi:xanthine dehydrogenase iron-sulfur cluster and FAD-binding subunit A
MCTTLEVKRMHEVQKQGTRPRSYVAPASLAEAKAILQHNGDSARIVAGGTDLLVELDRGAHRDVKLLVDISRIRGLDSITLEGSGADALLHVGPLVTHNQATASDLVLKHGLALAQACAEVGSPQLRNRATIVGNIVTASPANDTISALMALDATVHTTSTAMPSVPITDFFDGFRSVTLPRGELITGISIPANDAPVRRSMFAKVGLRKAQAISVVHGAIAIDLDDDDVVIQARIILGSVAATVVALPAISGALIGRRLDDEVIDEAAAAARAAVAPIADLRGTAEYRSATVEVIVRRMLKALRSNQQASAWSSTRPRLWGSVASGKFATATPVSELSNESHISVDVNGSNHRGGSATGESLLDWLRDVAGLTGTKEGCAEGECGACTVQLDGIAVMSCLVPAARAHETAVITVEGLVNADATPGPVQQAFVDCNGVQCGFCTPGFVVSTHTLLEETGTPDDDQIRHGLSGNLCRCTGYTSIIDAVKAVVVADPAPRFIAGGGAK